jgi:hypothetical protein
MGGLANDIRARDVGLRNVLGVVVLVTVLEGASAREGECPSMREVEAIVQCQAKVLNRFLLNATLDVSRSRINSSKRRPELFSGRLLTRSRRSG